MRAIDLPLTTEFRQKLARLLGMIGSDHDGEALNAARLADKLVRAAGITWFDIVAVPALPPPPPEPVFTGSDDPLDLFGTAADAVNFVLDYTPLLTEWELTFTRSLYRFSRLSGKQQAVLRRLVIRALETGAMP
jgi:hypothetical protein